MLAFRKEEKLLARIADPGLHWDEVICRNKTHGKREYLDRGPLHRDVGSLVLTIAPVADRWLGLLPVIGPIPPSSGACDRARVRSQPASDPRPGGGS